MPILSTTKFGKVVLFTAFWHDLSGVPLGRMGSFRDDAHSLIMMDSLIRNHSLDVPYYAQLYI